MCRRKMTTDVPLPMAESRRMKSPLTSVRTALRRICPAFGWLTRDVGVTSWGMSHGVAVDVDVSVCDDSTAKRREEEGEGRFDER